MLRIRLLNTDTDLEQIEEFHHRQAECYTGFAVGKAAKRAPTEDNIRFVVAETMTGKMVGGARFHLRTRNQPLPIERALPGDRRIHQAVRTREGGNVAEYAGLWALPEGRGTGLSAVLISTTVAASAMFNVRCGLGFTHHHLVFWTPIGFQVDEGLGFFAYPDPRYQSYVLWIDPMTLSHATEAMRHGINMIRSMLSQDRGFVWDSELGGEFDLQLRSIVGGVPYSLTENPRIALAL